MSARDICKRLLILGLTAFALAQSSPVFASVMLPMGSSPSSDLLVNFDLGSVNNVEVHLFVTLDPTNANGTVAIDLFDDLNGGDLLTSVTQLATTPTFFPVLAEPEVLDGVFSVGLRATTGSAGTLAGADAFAIVCVPSLSNCALTKSA